MTKRILKVARQTVEEQFWEKVDKSGKCWEWKAGKDKDGYGRFRIDGKMRRAHRIAYDFAHSSIPDGMQVLHHCDNPGCCRISHLFLGTNQDNVDDRERKGRGSKDRGEENANAKLTEKEVRQIKKEYARGNVTQVKLAEQYGVSRTTISMIIVGTNWAYMK